MIRRPPRSTRTDTLFPYTTLFRSTQGAGRYRWYVLAVLTIAQGCHALDRSVIGLVLEPVKIEFGLTDGEAGVLAGLSYGIAFALAAIPFGIAVDRFNRRNLLAMALRLWSGFTLICGLVTRTEERRVGKGCVRTCRSRG